MAPAQTITIDHLDVMTNQNNTIIMGDFNAKNKLWGSSFNDSRGLCIETFLENKEMVCLNKGEPTHLNYNGSLSHLDLVLSSNNLAFNTECFILDETWGSDHFPLEIRINDCSPISNIMVEQKYNLDKANWELFKTLIENSSIFDYKIENLEKNYDSFLSVILKAREDSIPKRAVSFKHKYTPYWNKECSEAKKNKKEATKNLRKNNCVFNQYNYKQCKKVFKNIIRKNKQIYWEKICEKINYKTKSSEIWKKVKNLKGSNSLNKVIFTLPNGDLKKDVDIANGFANTFSLISKVSQNDSDIIAIRKNTVNSFLMNYKQSIIYSNINQAITEDSKLLNELFHMSELETVLRAVNKKSSPGYDELSYQYLINLPHKAKTYYLNLLNYSWEFNIIPELWKISIVKPILKPKKDKKIMTHIVLYP